MRQKKDTVQSRRVKRNNHDKEVECNRREAVGHSKRTDEHTEPSVLSSEKEEKRKEGGTGGRKRGGRHRERMIESNDNNSFSQTHHSGLG